VFLRGRPPKWLFWSKNKHFGPLYFLKDIRLYYFLKNTTVFLLFYSNACSIWFKCNSTLRSKIDMVIRRVGRFVMCKTYYDSISSDNVNTIKWIDCASRLKYEVLILMFKFVHNMCPEYFLKYFDLVSIPDHNTRNSKYLSN